MKTIYVSTQKELDAAVKKKEVEIAIKDTKEWLSVYDNATIQSVYGNATIRSVSGNATIQSVSDNATIQSVYGNATIQSVSGNATIRSVSGNATIQSVSDNATIQSVYGNATIQSVSDNATIQSVYGNATINVYSDSVTILSVVMFAVVIMIGCVCKIQRKKKTATIVKTKKAERYTKQDFIDIYGADKAGNVTLYKSVNPTTSCDFYTGKIKYTGTVNCPDWDGSIRTQECGNGLHLSPLPHMALNYNKGKLLECKVYKKDFVVYPFNITKVRCRKVTVIGEYKPK